MDNFADYILDEEEIASKEIVYYLSKKTGIFFDKILSCLKLNYLDYF